jgi:hypothetical protein
MITGVVPGADVVGVSFAVAWFGSIVACGVTGLPFVLAWTFPFGGFMVVPAAGPRHGGAVGAHGVAVLLAGERLGSAVIAVVIRAGLLAASLLGAFVTVVACAGRCLVVISSVAAAVDAHRHVPAAGRR